MLLASIVVIVGIVGVVYGVLYLPGDDLDAESTSTMFIGLSALALALAAFVAMAKVAIVSVTRRTDARSTEAQTIVRCGMVFAAIAGLVAIPIAIFLSQYWPLFGGPLITEIAQPWSPARKSGIASHCIVLGILAALLAGVGGAAARFLRTTE